MIIIIEKSDFFISSIYHKKNIDSYTVLEVRILSVIAYSNAEIKLLARLMRAEAEGDGQKAMLLVGMVGVNRVRARCSDFKNITSIQEMVFQSPGGFEATQQSYFYQSARNVDIKLAKRVCNGERFEPGSRALWFFNPGSSTCPSTWWGQWNSGIYKSHCFYSPTESENCY